MLKNNKFYPLLRNIKKTVISHLPFAKQRALKFYSGIISKDSLCFDIGANVGDRTALFLKLGAKVVAVEPQSRCRKTLNKKYGKSPRVSLVFKGVSDKPGYAYLAICPQDNTLSTLSKDWQKESRFSSTHAWTDQEKVELTTLDTLIKDFGLPEFCKIDVEGHEDKVILGLSQSIPLISFESTKEFFDKSRAVLSHLADIGQILVNFSSGESMQFVFKDWQSPAKLLNYLTNLKDPVWWGDIYVRSLSNSKK